MPKVMVSLGEELFSFPDFNSWVNQASRFWRSLWRSHGVRAVDTLCIDAEGRVCTKGVEFMRARDEGSFPVKVYRLLSAAKEEGK